MTAGVPMLFRVLLSALLLAGSALAEPVLRFSILHGVTRAELLHAVSGERVTEENPAVPGERLVALVDGVVEGTRVLVGGEEVASDLVGEGQVAFTVPEEVGGSFVEIALDSPEGRSNAASFPTGTEAKQTRLIDPVSGPAAVQLTAEEVRAIIAAAATAVGDSRLAVAVVDRGGRPLAVWSRPGASEADVDTAVARARTAAFFSHNQAPLSSRTVRTISRENFPNDIPNQPAAALFGIENTNRGCKLADRYDEGKDVPRSFRVRGDNYPEPQLPSRFVEMRPGGVPLYRAGSRGPNELNKLIGGVGAAVSDNFDAAEFAAAAGAVTSQVGGQARNYLDILPLPPPASVFIDGIRLPFVRPETLLLRPPAGATPDQSGNALATGAFVRNPVGGMPISENWLVSPRAGQFLSADEVRGVIERTIAQASRTRAVIRLPLGTRAKFVIAVTDLDGSVLGLFRMEDSTIFSIDVAVTKARNVTYFSGPDRKPEELPGLPMGTAVTNRTIGFSAQRFFPSGILNSQPGPFRPLYEFDLANPCTQGMQAPNPNQSGIVFFPGSAPLYRSGRIVAGLGVSGDGVEQDDYATAGGIPGLEPDPALRADQVFIRDVRLPYLKFPRNPEQ